jgi:hypothetical protein
MNLTRQNIDAFEFIAQLIGDDWNKNKLWEYPPHAPERANYEYGSEILNRMILAAAKT